jgi:hypothetical protein
MLKLNNLIILGLFWKLQLHLSRECWQLWARHTNKKITVCSLIDIGKFVY